VNKRSDSLHVIETGWIPLSTGQQGITSSWKLQLTNLRCRDHEDRRQPSRVIPSSNTGEDITSYSSAELASRLDVEVVAGEWLVSIFS
jgi:hypothetical protein